MILNKKGCISRYITNLSKIGMVSTVSLEFSNIISLLVSL